MLFAGTIVDDGVVELRVADPVVVASRPVSRSRVAALRSRVAPKTLRVARRTVTMESPSNTPPVGTPVQVNFSEDPGGQWIAGRTSRVCILRSNTRSFAVPCFEGFPVAGQRYTVTVDAVNMNDVIANFSVPRGEIEPGNAEEEG